MRVGLVVLAILVGIFLAVGQCGSGSNNGDGKDHSRSSSSDEDHDRDKNHDRSASDRDDHSDDGTSHADAMQDRLESQGLHVQQMSAWSEDDCAAHSYGEVSDYFRDHPCRSLERAWYEVCDDNDNKAVVSAAWVRMPDDHEADELHQLVDRPGTGNITEMSKEDGPHGDVRYSGWYYNSDRSGDTFSSVQAEPLQDSDGSRDVAREASGTTSAD